MNPVEVSKTAESRIRGMIELRDCVRTLLEYQTEDYPDEEIKAQQAKLNVLYDAFTRASRAFIMTSSSSSAPRSIMSTPFLSNCQDTQPVAPSPLPNLSK